MAGFSVGVDKRDLVIAVPNTKEPVAFRNRLRDNSSLVNIGLTFEFFVILV